VPFEDIPGSMQSPAGCHGIGDALRGQLMERIPGVGGYLSLSIEERAVEVKYYQFHNRIRGRVGADDTLIVPWYEVRR